MFTGLIEEIGSVRHVVSGAEWGSIAIGCRNVLSGTKIGDSIAVNGVCLTVTDLKKDGFTADVMAETLHRSSLGTLRQGDPEYGRPCQSGARDACGREVRRAYRCRAY